MIFNLKCKKYVKIKVYVIGKENSLWNKHSINSLISSTNSFFNDLTGISLENEGIISLDSLNYESKEYAINTTAIDHTTITLLLNNLRVNEHDSNIINVILLDNLILYNLENKQLTLGIANNFHKTIFIPIYENKRIGKKNYDLLLTRIFAHELGHVLGLIHSDGSSNIMQSDIEYSYDMFNDLFNSNQIDIINSNNNIQNNCISIFDMDTEHNTSSNYFEEMRINGNEEIFYDDVISSEESFDFTDDPGVITSNNINDYNDDGPSIVFFHNDDGSMTSISHNSDGESNISYWENNGDGTFIDQETGTILEGNVPEDGESYSAFEGDDGTIYISEPINEDTSNEDCPGGDCGGSDMPTDDNEGDDNPYANIVNTIFTTNKIMEKIHKLLVSNKII